MSSLRARRTGLGALIVLAAMSISIAAAAGPDVQACLSASEKGQKARTAGKLREAREHFVICGSDTCPALVRHDCAQWNSELASTLPTVVFGAKDHQGRDLFDVTVSMDGEMIVKKLDGKSVTVDPGKHTFRFESPGLTTVTETALIKEGERARVLSATFDGPSVPKPVKDPSPSTDRPVEEGGHTPYPWIVVGLGAVGVIAGAVIVLTSPDRPANCNATTLTCTRLPNESDADFKRDQEKAGSADSQPVVGFVVAGGGLAVAIGGLLWHFLEPTGPKKQAAGSTRGVPSDKRFEVAPFMNGETAGLVVHGAL